MKDFSEWVEPKETRQPKASPPPGSNDVVRVRYCIDKLKARGVDITSNYPDWIKLGFSLAGLGPESRGLFHELSSIHPDYDFSESDKKYDELSKNNSGSVTIATFYQYCQDHGIKYKPYQDNGSSAQPKEENDLKSKIKVLEYNHSKELVKPDPIVSIDGQTISTKDNLTVLTGGSKSGKSGILGVVMAGTMKMEGGVAFDTCGLDIEANKDKKLVVHYDLEQCEWDYYKLVRNTFKRSGRSNPPGWFKSLHLLEISLSERRRYLKESLNYYTNEFGGIYMIIVDGIGDFVKSVNDEIECNEVANMFYELARVYNCPLLTVLHLNPGKEAYKSRGHLGSQLERKCESMLTITKSGDTSTIEPKLLRNGGFFDAVRFEYDLDKGFHVYAGTKQEDIERIKKESRQRMADQVFKGESGGMYAKELQASIEQIDGCKERTAKTRIKEMKESKIIEMREDNKYYLSENKSLENGRKTTGR